MLVVELPVAPLSKKILLKKYGAEPIQFPRHDLTYQLLYYRHPKARRDIKRIEQIVTDIIQIRVSKNCYQNIKKGASKIGYLFYNYHLNDMMKFVEVATMSKSNAVDALNVFYDHYGISEDDFSRDSAYKRWQRFKSKIKISSEKQILFFKKTRQDGSKIEKQICIKLERSEKVIEYWLEQTFEKNINYFYFNNGQFRDKLLKQLLIYLLYRHAGYKLEDIATLVKNSNRNIYYQLRAFSDFLEVTPDFEIVLSD